MFKIIAGSIVKSKNGYFWYCCGDWSINNLKSLPCILSYVPIDNEFGFSDSKYHTKQIEIDNKKYLKTFGQDIKKFQDLFYQANREIDFSIGKVAFLKRENIFSIKNPKDFVQNFVRNVKKDGQIFCELMDILKLPKDSVGISGSCLMFDKPIKRHEIDFVIYGIRESVKAKKIILVKRKNGIFSQNSLGKFHLPFKYKGVWFDPQFAFSEDEKNFINNHKISILEDEKDITLKIIDDSMGIFFPAIYITDLGRLISFRPGHRGLFKKNNYLKFKSLKKAILENYLGKKEFVNVIINDEWCEIV